jgi:predicted nucleic acid-binding protein
VPDIVSNASPLIVLAKAEFLALLPVLFGQVFVPTAVAAEIKRGPDDDPMRRLLGSRPWLRTVQLDPSLSPLAAWQLGLGESEVLEYARTHPGLPVLLDDRAARRAAFGLNLRVYGSLTVLAFAAKSGHIPSFRSAAQTLVRVGLRVSPLLIDEVEEELRVERAAKN